MKIRLVLFAFCLMLVCPSFAYDKTNGLEVIANVKDNVTLEAIENGFATLLLTDSTIVDTASIRTYENTTVHENPLTIQ